MEDKGSGAASSTGAADEPDDGAVDDGLSGALPPVVAVLVTHDPGPWFDQTLRSLKDQTYGALSVLVIDAASSESPTPRIAAELPGAYVRRIDRNVGFGDAANEVLGSVEGAAFYLFCHDDVALEPDAVRTLVEESFRSNAGISGPKLVDWNDPRRLRQVGASVDKTGALARFAEPGELDQEQHDAVRDVFVVPGACTLVRADLFAALGGFDAGIDFLGDDLDLCWRAHLAGARVLVVPSATVRHLEALGARRAVDDRRRLLARHRLRTMLSCYRPVTLLRVLPQAILFTLIEAVYALAAGEAHQAADVCSAWTWNLRRIGAIRRKRKAIRGFRTVPDSEVRDLQVRGSARVSAFVRGQIGKGGDDRLSAMTRSGRQFAGTLKARSSRGALILGAVVVGVVLLGTRNLFARPIPAIGEFADFPSAHTLLRAWASGWRGAGLGADGPSPTGLGLLGAGSWLLFGSAGLLRQLLILGMLPIGFLGAWRLARPIGSLRAGIAAFVVYAAIPVPYNALASGAWGGLVLYAASPWVLLQLARATRLAPYGRADLADDSPEVEHTPPSRSFGRQVLALGVLLAVAGAFVPFVIAVALLVAVAAAVGSVFAGKAQGAVRIVLVALGASAVAVVMHLPWSLDLLRPGVEWSAFAGIGASRSGVYSVSNLLGFASGPFGAAPLGWVFLVSGALSLVIGKGWRYQWAVRAWFVALAGWGFVWAGQENWLPVALPPPEVLLAPVAAALALAAAMGMAAFEVDLPGYRFGWRQAVSSVAALAVVVGVLPLLGGVVDGRWRVPGGDLDRPLNLVLAHDHDPPSRILWVGDPELLPVNGRRLDDRISYGTTDGAPGIGDRWAATTHDRSTLLGHALTLAAERRTSRLGALLAPMGVRYLIVPNSNAPTAFSGISRPAPPSFLAALSEQLDLTEVDSDPSLLVYRNTAWVGMVTTQPRGTTAAGSFTGALAVDPTTVRPVLTARTGPTSWSGPVPGSGEVYLAEGYSANWRLQVGGVEVGRDRAYRWANRFTITQPGRGDLEYHTPPLRQLLAGLQVVVWIVAFALLRRTSPTRRRGRWRRRSRGRGTVEPDPVATDEPVEPILVLTPLPAEEGAP